MTGSAELWPWLTLASLGLFHGINPAMGWLFAVALGLQRDSQRVVLLSLVPIAAGHAAAVAVVLTVVLVLGRTVDQAAFVKLTGAVLIAWALWDALYGHRHRLRVGMQTGLAGLALWSFLMAGSHGAGLMVIPALGSICGTATAGSDWMVPAALAALGVHSAAMLLTIAAVSLVVYNCLGIDFMRRGWINFDFIWIVALALCGIVLLA